MHRAEGSAAPLLLICKVFARQDNPQHPNIRERIISRFENVG